MNDLEPAKSKKKRSFKFKMVSAFTMLMGIIAFFVVLSWILNAAGVTTTWQDENGSTETGKIAVVGFFDIFLAPMKGFIDKAEIIIFIVTLGAFISVVMQTKSMEGLSQGITRKMKGKEIWAIPPLMLFFSVCGTTEGMAEESIGFYMVTVPLMIAAGFDTITGLMIVLLGAGVGVMGSTVNPFLVTVAVNSILDGGFDPSVLSVGDGLIWRLVAWLLLTVIAIGFVMWYAKRVKTNPSKSVTFKTYEEDKEYFLKNTDEEIKMNGRRIATMVVFGITFIIMIMYLIGWDTMLNTSAFENAGQWFNDNIPWITSQIPGFGVGYLSEIAAFFLISTIIIAAINWKSEEEFISTYMAGAADILSVCLVIATAAGVGFVLTWSHEQELFVNGLVSGLGGVQPVGLVILLFIIFIPLSFLIPSTSGFAAAIFPLLAGSSTNPGIIMQPDAIAITASGSIAAFSFASGIVNFVTPTSGVVMGALAISKVSYDQLWKAIWPFILMMVGASIVLLGVGGAVGGTVF
ncbi:YfcC family protein [Spiroplasma endosymbiont of Amphibalanus improvisus]|uniref:YfcC family protein n=1 Tax=Spiroplasma endosymbiont of Amphibalanus improvisus TaxID=3066327 RepID=UPI00313DD029